jgi:hypothetical protein
MYSGLKHSSCSEYINENGYSMDQVQMMTDHARRESAKRYASVQLEAKRRLLDGKIGWLWGLHLLLSPRRPCNMKIMDQNANKKRQASPIYCVNLFARSLTTSAADGEYPGGHRDSIVV